MDQKDDDDIWKRGLGGDAVDEKESDYSGSRAPSSSRWDDIGRHGVEAGKSDA